MFWDGDRWVPEQQPPLADDRNTPRRLRDWLATGVMIVGLIAVAVPIVGVSAKTPGARTTIAT